MVQMEMEPFQQSVNGIWHNRMSKMENQIAALEKQNSKNILIEIQSLTTEKNFTRGYGKRRSLMTGTTYHFSGNSCG